MSLEYGNDDTISYTYDNLGRVKTSATSGGKNVSYAYNGEGQLYKTTVGDWTWESVYDTLGRPVSAAQFRQETVDGEQKWVEKLRLHNQYNENNQITKQIRLLPEKTITTTFAYDSNGRLTTYNSGAGYNSTLTYDALSRLSTVTDRTNKRTYSYADGAGENTTTTRVSTVTYTGAGSGTNFQSLTYSYTYDSRGNILTITDPISGNRSYTYDALGQMTKEVINGTTYTYAYDKVGNLTSYCGNTLAYNDSQWQDRLSTYKGYAQYYDGMGNPTSYHNGTGRWNFTWDGRELTQAVKSGTSYPSSYSYDENGLRTTKTVVSASGTTTHTYLYAADGTLIREIRNNPDGTTDTMEFLYDHAGQPYSFVLNNVMYFYVVNLQGDVVRIVDTSGRTVASYVYNAWGKQISATPNTSLANAANVTNKNPLRYRGYYYDTETQLYYLQSRYYDPNLGRFLNADGGFDTGAGLVGYNLYSYCANSPVAFRDTSGYAIETALDIISIVLSFIDLLGKPSLTAAGYLAWDIGAAIVPFLPASYALKWIQLSVKVAGKIDDLIDGSHLLTGTYNRLRKIFKGIGNVEVHHLIEKRFAALFSCAPGEFLSIPLTSELHQIITKRWRYLHELDRDFKNFAYGSNYKKITYEQMVQAVKQVYADMPKLLDEVLAWLAKNWGNING